MLRSVIRHSKLVVIGLLLTGCSWMPWNRARRRAAAELQAAEAGRAPLVLGRVSLVNEGERFALIEAEMTQAPPPGTMLRIYTGNAVTAELRATGVRRRPFLVADLVSGMPAKGDYVVQPKAGEAAPPRATATSPAAPPATPAPSRWPRWLGFLRGRN